MKLDLNSLLTEKILAVAVKIYLKFMKMYKKKEEKETPAPPPIFGHKLSIFSWGDIFVKID